MDVELAEGPNRSHSAAHNVADYVNVKNLAGDRVVPAPSAAQSSFLRGRGSEREGAAPQGLEELAAE
jgi:hypothetical protein